MIFTEDKIIDIVNYMSQQMTSEIFYKIYKVNPESKFYTIKFFALTKKDQDYLYIKLDVLFGE